MQPQSHLRSALGASLLLISPIFGLQSGPNDPGIVEPALSATTGVEVRVTNTDQAVGSTALNIASAVVEVDAKGALSLTGHVINDLTSPNRAMRDALKDLADAAKKSKLSKMTAAATELESILLGTTEGRIYDGFAMLNYNRGAFTPDQMPGEYKMKLAKDTGLTILGMDGQPRKIWEVDVSMLWYDGQFDSDTFLLRFPIGYNEFDTLRVNYRIYSLVREELAPTAVISDYRLPKSVQFPFKGFDSVWEQIGGKSVTTVSVDMPPIRLLRGVYHWGWRVHPPRIQFLQPIFEIVNAHTGAVELEPQGESYAYRNRQLSIAGIGDAAPEKKMYDVAQAVLTGGATPAQVLAMLEDDATAPRGNWKDWADLAADQIQLPPEAQDILTAEGITPGTFGPYRFVSVYLNNEMYGKGPRNEKIEGWNQGDQFQVKLINLDKHMHYFRNVDFGPRLHDDIKKGFSAGSHSFEIMNFKPAYGAPKVAESQWRAGWGFRPHYDVLQQQDVFPRPGDQVMLKPFTDGQGLAHLGYQYSAAVRGGDFRFNPPPFIITNTQNPAPLPLAEDDGSTGLLIGQLTEGYGVASMCDHLIHPLGGFCQNDVGPYNPHGVLNVDTDGDGVNDVLWFPPFLRNPNPNGGDIIPPTPAWKPFLWLNPNNGTLFMDPNDPTKGYWADLTYAHGAPIAPGTVLNAHLECPRASGQVFYQFDDLFHDNAIFSPHPKKSRHNSFKAPLSTL